MQFTVDTLRRRKRPRSYLPMNRLAKDPTDGPSAVKRKRNCASPPATGVLVLALASIIIYHLPAAFAFHAGGSTYTHFSDHFQIAAQRRPRSSFTRLEAFRLLVANARVFSEEDDRISSVSSASATVSELAIQHGSYVQRKQYHRALSALTEMLETLNRSCLMGISNKERVELSLVIDSCVQKMTSQAFVENHNMEQNEAVLAGAEAVFHQLSARGLAAPYNKISRRTLLDALNALTALSKKANSHDSSGDIDTPRILDYSFRILQRLVTGVGVRQSQLAHLSEKDFAQVLVAFCDAGQMEMAHRIVALQERTPHAPAVSPVAYSILLKAYGRLRERNNVERVLRQAERNRIQADTIMLNTLIDAYINCNAMDQATKVFQTMVRAMENEDDKHAHPNRRTYNTMLKGYAQCGDLAQARAFAKNMKDLKLWDSVTTNTLVHAAIVSNNCTAAADILSQHTLTSPKFDHQPWHPNVEAYTELLDGYARAGQLEEALGVLNTMQDRGVIPNEVTYTCLMGGFGRRLELDRARQTFADMESLGLKATTRSFNALISGLLSEKIYVRSGEGPVITTSLDGRIDQAMGVLQDMIQARVRPDATTVSILVDALGRCQPPRVSEATLLADRLERKGYFLPGHAKVYTSLLVALGRQGDLDRVLEFFRKIHKPDTVAVNAFLDACRRCNRPRMVTETFHFYFRGTKSLQPNLISYTAVLQALLQRNTLDSLQQARNFYMDMKVRAKLQPDHALVDILLKGIIRIAATQNLGRSDVSFVATVIQDAELLDWAEGQLERRKTAVRAVFFTDRMREMWRGDDTTSFHQRGMLPENDDTDVLFQRKGWNKVDSGFRLWGGGRTAVSSDAAERGKTSDEFLKSHGWNDVDSGFRLF